MQLKIIDYETAKLAKDVGFEKKWCDVAYREDDKKLYMDTGMYTDYPAPTQELLRQFLRTEHGIHISADPMITSSKEQVTFKEWTADILRKGENLPDVDLGNYNSYEKALEAGLKEALNYLLNKNN